MLHYKGVLEIALGAKDAKLNLAKASVLIVESSQQSLELMVQLFNGFGTGAIHPAESIEAADRLLKFKKIDLLLIDPTLGGGLGFELIQTVRRGGGMNADAPIFLIMGHVRKSDVAHCRDSGANYVITKPISAARIAERILWVQRDSRSFIDCPTYCGPDRRFKFEGPPRGMDGRRSTDLKSALGDPGEPNLSADEVATMLKPQRVSFEL